MLALYRTGYRYVCAYGRGLRYIDLPSSRDGHAAHAYGTRRGVSPCKINAPQGARTLDFELKGSPLPTELAGHLLEISVSRMKEQRRNAACLWRLVLLAGGCLDTRVCSDD